MSLAPSSSSSAPSTTRRWQLPMLLLVAAPLFAAATQDGCQIIIVPDPGPEDCSLQCEYGFKTDEAGNQYCECIESDVCILIYPAPHQDPETGDCVQFSDVCNIPDGWEPCSNGCDVDGELVPFGATVQTECGECRCRADGEVICDDTNCSDGCTVDGVTYPAGSSFPAPDGCNECFCGDDGNYGCTEMACVEGCYDANGDYREPGESFPAGDGCNQCSCDGDGTISCTLQACEESCEYNGSVYETGESFPAADGCNTCFCELGGGVSCTEIACTDCLLACEYGFKTDLEGNQYCECRESDVCIEIAPAPHFDPNDETGTCIAFPSVCDIPNDFLPCEQMRPIECDGEILCDALPPTCAPGQVPSIENGCWGDCVDEELCQ